MSKNDTLIVEGGTKLSGNVLVSGAKNAALPIMAASLLSEGSTKLKNLPIVADVLTMKAALEKLGIRICLFEDSASIDGHAIDSQIMPVETSKKMRASVLVAGPLIARFGEAVIAQPGGCVIGCRPINLHLMGFRELGAKIERINKEYLRIKASKLKGNTINLPFPSMGATENLMMAACLAEGKTVISNAAREPEIVDLAVFLNKMGANVKGAGTPLILIDGVKTLESIEHTIMPDRIEAGTFIMAAAITQGQVHIKNIIPEHLAKVIEVLKKIGVCIRVESDTNNLVVEGQGKHTAANVVTGPYPGFPTDLQPLLTSVLTLSHGVSTVTDTVFPERFCYVNQLREMGADISVVGNSAKVKSVQSLLGADVSATDLRGGAAIVLSGLAADGKTIIRNCSQIYRGYANIKEKLQKLGASVQPIRSDEHLFLPHSPDLAEDITLLPK